MRTVYDLWVFAPQGMYVIASTWRSDYATDLLSELLKDIDTGTGSRWTGACMWREV